ncbi:hypothetical protein AB1Y20_019862 [Prymnesium parvum]|uniref:Lysine decarboxylase n=1 Tax=Prymnesium parvum TaxID=97485 RepID=A0AB34JWA0_PRYPA
MKRGRAGKQVEYHRDPSEWEMPACPVVKAYKNWDFLGSSHARHIRILTEYEETLQRLRANNVRSTVMFFGSARSKDRKQYDKAMKQAKAELEAAEAGSEAFQKAEGVIKRLETSEWMCEYMEKTTELARRITEWGMLTGYCPKSDSVSGVARSSELKRRIERSASQDKHLGEVKVPSFAYLPHSTDESYKKENGDLPSALEQSLFVCTGGGPGFMEAANKGAAMVTVEQYDERTKARVVRPGRSIGMGITLPFETGLNPYVTPELAFEYHYFFTRKFWMAFYMQALVVAPGGFGTCDELFEIMTLKQTGKMNKQMPVVLFGKKYWEDIINWKALASYGTIAQNDVDELCFTDSVDEAFEFLTKALMKGAMVCTTHGYAE